jgi:hypothetical protein
MLNRERNTLGYFQTVIDNPESSSTQKGFALQSIARLKADMKERRARDLVATFRYKPSLDAAVEAGLRSNSQSRVRIVNQIVTDLKTAQAGGRSHGATETVGRLLDLFWQTESDSLRRRAYLALLSYRFLQSIPENLEEEIDAIEECCPEMSNALSESTEFYLGRLAG